MRKLLNLLLTFVLCITLIPTFSVSVSAEEQEYDILYSDIVAKGSYYAYPAGTKIKFDTLPQHGTSTPDEYKIYSSLDSYDYAVKSGFVVGEKDSNYEDCTAVLLVNETGTIYTLPSVCNGAYNGDDYDAEINIKSGGYWVFINNNGYYEFFAVESSGEEGYSITVNSNDNFVECVRAYKNYTETTTDDIYFKKKIESKDDLNDLFTNGGYGYLANNITISANLTISYVGEVNLFLNGKTIDLNENYINVSSGATLNLYDNGTTGIIKNGKNTDNGDGCGGAFHLQANSGEHSVLNMYGGTIKDCVAKYGGAIGIHMRGTFNMYGGLITLNSAEGINYGFGGAIYNVSPESFHMHGGTITNNWAEVYGGGIYNADIMTFDGKCIVEDNYSGPKNAKIESNVHTGTFTPVENADSEGLTEGSRVGITYNGGTGDITSEAYSFDQTTQTSYYFADNPNYYVAYNEGTGNGGYLEIKAKTICKIGDTEYTSIEAALEHGEGDPTEKDPNTGESSTVSTTIVLVDNDRESVTIESTRNITLDLNGYVLQANGDSSVIVNNGTLTIIDSNTNNQTHNFKVGSDGLWTLTKDEYTKEYESLIARPNTNDIIKVKGGCITGGKGTTVLLHGAGQTTFNARYGGGIYNTGTLTINNGNVVGNEIEETLTYGGGIYNSVTGQLIISGGRIIGNKANCSDDALSSKGGGIYQDDKETNNISLDMTGGDVCFNVTRYNGEVAGCGGGVYLNDESVRLTGGRISYNLSQNGGGVFSMMLCVGGTVKICNNIGITLGNNLLTTVGFLDKDSQGRFTVEVPKSGMSVGITMLTAEPGVLPETPFAYSVFDYGSNYFFSDDSSFAISSREVTSVDAAAAGFNYEYFFEIYVAPPILLVPHDVIFHNLEGINMELPTSIEFGTNISLEDIKPTKKGYIFEGFYRDSNYKYKVDTLVYNIVEEVYAKWVKYDIYEANEYIKEIEFNKEYTLEEAKKIALNECIDECEYVLIYAPNQYVIYNSESKEYTSGETNLNILNFGFAIGGFEGIHFLGKLVYIKFYNVTYELNGSTITSLIYDDEYQEETTLDLPEVSKEGYTFNGWFLDKDLTIKYTSDYVIDKDITLYASFTKVEEEPTLTETFVSRLYACFLRHKKYGYDFIIALKDDPEGVAYWTDELDRGIQTGASITYNFYLSDEYQSILNNEYNTQIERDSRFIKDLYRAMHGREAEDIGYNYWMNDLANGQTYKQVIDNISRSNEFRSMCKEHNIIAIKED